MDGGSAGPRPEMLRDGVGEGGLAQMDGRHADPKAQAEQPGHDWTHLFREGGQRKTHRDRDL